MISKKVFFEFIKQKLPTLIRTSKILNWKKLYNSKWK